MKLTLLTIGLLLFFISCDNKREKINIDKFVWMQHNQNWIWNPADLEARFYLEFQDSGKKIRLSKTNIGLKQSVYFITNAPDSLGDLIIKNLYSKKFPNSFEDKGEPHIYDGDFYCIIYKFNNGNEQILNYKPFTIPDSLRKFTDYLEKLTQLTSFVKTDSFDRKSLIDKYRDLIIPCGPLSPPSAPITDQVKYVTPVVRDTMK